MTQEFNAFKREQQAHISALLAQPNDWLLHQQLLDQATHVYLHLLRALPTYPPAVALRVELADVIDTTVPSHVLGELLLSLLA